MSSVGPADVAVAAAALADVVHHTPVLDSSALSELAGGRVVLKCENLQRAGSFKIRGAFVRIARLSEDERRAGVVAASAGNHAQGVALAASLLGCSATVVMPVGAPLPKIAATEGYGATVRLIGANVEESLAAAAELAVETGAIFIHPFDHVDVVAGQGTVGLEIVEQRPDVAAVLAPVSGGGLIAGIALAVKARSPQTQIHSVEPEGFDDHARSLESGRRERNEKASGSICDALLSNTPGELTFEINRALIGEGVAASDEEAGRAVAFAFRELKLVVEPGGAIGLAALLAGKLDVRGKTVVVVLSGGNVDAELFNRLIAA